MAKYPEVESIVTQSGRPDDGTDTEGFYSGEYFVRLRPRKTGPSSCRRPAGGDGSVARCARGRNAKSSTR